MMASWFLLFLLFLVPFALILLVQKCRKSKRIRKPPGPRGLPFIGNLHQYFDSAKPHEFLGKLSKKYGPLLSLRFGKVPVVVISSAETVKEALKANDLIFSGRPQRVGAKKLSYNGVDMAFSPYGEYWREMRKISALHLFSPTRVQSFRPVLEEEVSLLIKKIANLSSSSQVFDFSSMATNLTSTIMCRIGFGKKYDGGGHEEKRFDKLLRESQAMFAGFFFSDYLPPLSWMDKLTGMLDRLEKNFRELDSFYQEVIEDHLNPNRPETMKNDVLDILIQMKHQQQSSHFDLTWDHIKAMLMNVFIAGTDPNAATIIWAMTALVKAPSAMKRVQAEIRDLARQKGGIKEDVLQELPYLDAVIKETLRLYPPAPLSVPRETLKDCSIEGYYIEAKTLVFINAWAIGRDPENWENSEDFSPERFLDSNIDVRGNDFEVIPFGAGRRICPGIHLGMSTVKVSLANLLYSFDWELPLGMKLEDIETDVLPGITMHKKTPLCLVARKYTSSSTS